MTIQNPLGYIKGITVAPFHKRGSLSAQTARDSFDYMIEHTAADFVILAPVGLQDHAHSEEMEEEDGHEGLNLLMVDDSRRDVKLYRFTK